MAELPPSVSLVRIRMYHTDLVGVFHGRIFEVFEEARTEVFRRLGYEYRSSEARGLALVVLGVDAVFASRLHIDDLVEVGVYVSYLTRARVTVEYEVRRPGDARAAVTGHTTFAYIDATRGCAVPLPPEVLAAIERCPEMRRERR